MEFVALAWHMETRKIRELVPTEKNPRKLTAQGREQLEQKIRELGLFEVPTIDVDGRLLNFNQRFKILMALGRGEEMIDVRVPNRKLTDEEVKKIVITSNVHDGIWDMIVLDEHYSEIDLDALGLDIKLDHAEAEAQIEQEAEPVYPIVRKFSEQYNSLVIVCEDEINFNHISEILGLETQACYKTSRVGTSKVIIDKDFLQRLKEWKSR